ncbi:MAG: hypothetical protein ACRD0K_02760 [Egibacteraceae bacterium]
MTEEHDADRVQAERAALRAALRFPDPAPHMEVPPPQRHGNGTRDAQPPRWQRDSVSEPDAIAIAVNRMADSLNVLVERIDRFSERLEALEDTALRSTLPVPPRV